MGAGERIRVGLGLEKRSPPAGEPGLSVGPAPARGCAPGAAASPGWGLRVGAQQMSLQPSVTAAWPCQPWDVMGQDLYSPVSPQRGGRARFAPQVLLAGAMLLLWGHGQAVKMPRKTWRKE